MGAWVLLPQWLGTAAAFWLVWWAARSRDATALKVVALLLAIVPAVLMPILTLIIPYYRDVMSVSNIGMTIAIASAVVGIVRALFLAIWAMVSKDVTVLRAVGGVIAGLLIVGYLIGFMAAILLGIAH